MFCVHLGIRRECTEAGRHDGRWCCQVGGWVCGERVCIGGGGCLCGGVWGWRQLVDLHVVVASKF